MAGYAGACHRAGHFGPDPLGYHRFDDGARGGKRTELLTYGHYCKIPGVGILLFTLLYSDVWIVVVHHGQR